jgi:hypothetical protein
MCFAESIEDIFTVLALGCSPVFDFFLGFLSPSVDYSQGPLGKLPVANAVGAAVKDSVRSCVTLAEDDWNSRELSWDFRSHPLLSVSAAKQPAATIAEAYGDWLSRGQLATQIMKDTEESINRIVIGAYGLSGELSPAVSLDQITLSVNPSFRYGVAVAGDDEWQRFRHETVAELLSYAVGCMMGRYSLDRDGLVYALSGSADFDFSQYSKFPADDDGIVSVTEVPWFDDDAANRFERFVKTVWPVEALEENLAFVAENLGAKKAEAPRETIRRYFAGDFYKHHLQAYKNRPIYWLFTSGKQGAFEALVYLHRYNEGTLSRMRTEYVVPLLGKLNGRIAMLADTIATATSTKQRKDAEREKDKLTKQQAELQAFDEKLRHYADQRITLDLDDGVKVNYGKFGDLLADVKKVCGTQEEH